jgi:hypothetical protein
MRKRTSRSIGSTVVASSASGRRGGGLIPGAATSASTAAANAIRKPRWSTSAGTGAGGGGGSCGVRPAAQSAHCGTMRPSRTDVRAWAIGTERPHPAHGISAVVGNAIGREPAQPPHSYTIRPDAMRALARLGSTTASHRWHRATKCLPTYP